MLNSHYEAWKYKKNKHKKIKGYRKSAQKKPTVERCLLILDLKQFRSYVKGKHSIDREFQNLAVQRKTMLLPTQLLVAIYEVRTIIVIQLTLSNSNPKGEIFFFELQRDSNSRKSLLFEFSGLKGENSNQREKY